MSNLSKEATDRIQVDAENYSKLFKHGVEYRKPAYADGALHEAERAQGLVDALDMTISIVSAYVPHDERNCEQQILFNLMTEIDNALAKYKEAGNG